MSNPDLEQMSQSDPESATKSRKSLFIAIGFLFINLFLSYALLIVFNVGLTFSDIIKYFSANLVSETEQQTELQMKIPSPTSTPTTLPLPEKESVELSWKRFRNFNGGYSINFPESWFIREKPTSQDDRLEISNKPTGRSDEYIGSDEVYLSIRVNGFHAPARLFEIQPREDFEQNYFIYSKLEDFVVDGYPAVKYKIKISPNHPGTEWNDPEAVYAIKHDSAIFLFYPLTLNKVIFDQHAQVIREIVSSFRAL